MADTDNPTAPEAAAAQAPATPKISVQAQYVRDSSFENVAVQSGDGKMDGKPDIQVGVNLDAKKRADTLYEVILRINATARNGEAVMFITELEYAGIFKVEDIPENQLHPYLLIECPRILFPFARRIVSDLTRDGGYPPLMLDMVDFAGLYRSELERRRSAAAQPNGEAPAT